MITTNKAIVALITGILALALFTDIITTSPFTFLAICIMAFLTIPIFQIAKAITTIADKINQAK